MRSTLFCWTLWVSLALCGCSPHPAPSPHPELVIQLRWVKGYPGEKRRDVETGLDWALSFLGAALPADAKVYRWDGNRVTVDLDAAQILPQSAAAWVSLLDTLKASDEYRRTGALDIGRFVTLTLCSARQYLSLTAAPPTFAGFQSRHPQQRQPVAIVQSGIARGNRLLELGPGGGIGELSFIAYEGTGAIADGSFERAEIETIDFMPNGQLRFGLYDMAGHQKLGTTSALTAAGKPSKCLWCHEIRLQPPFKNVTDVPGYLPTAQMRALVSERMQSVEAYRDTLRSRIDFRRIYDHTYAELLYMSFTEPSAARLAEEWTMSEARVKALLAGHRTHAQQERPILGDQLYDRADIDRFSPYQTLRAPSEARESGGYEPLLIDPASSQPPGESAHAAGAGRPH